MARWILVPGALLVLSCGGDHGPTIVRLDPLNRSTAVDTLVVPEVAAGPGASVSPRDRKIVLYDVTGGGRVTVLGNVEVEGTAIRYEPQAALNPDHEYELVLQPGSIQGERLDDVDASETPHELMSWPYRVAFSTGSSPRVRAAYLEAGRSILIRFSQPMNPSVTQEQVRVLGRDSRFVALQEPVWPDDRSLRLPLRSALDPLEIYTVVVGKLAVGADGILLDGDGDGRPGEPEDDFSARFTGSQTVIVSRLPREDPAAAR